MIRRRLGLGAAVTALAVPLSGCVTVHGERALIPSVSRAEAAQVLAHFADRNTAAKRAFDERIIASVEAGPLGTIDQAGMRAKHADAPGGNKSLTPLRFSDTRYAIPEQRGWPKFFVADTRTNRNGDARWLLAFRRDSPDAPWRADFLGVAAPGQVPDLATDKAGHAIPVPAAGTNLSVQPGKLSDAYAAYLGGASGGPEFAAGTATSALRQLHTAEQHGTNTVTQYADQGDSAGDFAPIALRTRDGGALVFFGSRHQIRATFRAGYQLDLDKDTQALTTGTPKTSITLSRVAQEVAEVPPRSAGGKVAVLSRLDGLVGAKGE
ncbi:hypothetical protein [Actinacidiphila yeochonensis]|uniref:hypothetical protein n=1 Tax=Actinacidiphila yeochonensis TaxID=89050 RepID=UPI00068941A0|nr:hypothetical protein [Actinacidiphila yeochonensis]